MVIRIELVAVSLQKITAPAESTIFPVKQEPEQFRAPLSVKK